MTQRGLDRGTIEVIFAMRSWQLICRRVGRDLVNPLDIDFIERKGLINNKIRYPMVNAFDVEDTHKNIYTNMIAVRYLLHRQYCKHYAV